VTSSNLTAAAAYLAERDAVLAPIVAAVGAPALRRGASLFGALAGSIVGQQLSVKAAAAIRQRLDGLMPNGAGLTPEGILAQSPDDLRAAGLSRAKVAYLTDLAIRVHDGVVDLETISQLDDEAVIAELVQVKGIGRWTVEMFLIFALNRLDVLPVDDLGFRTALKRNYGLDHLPTAGEVREIARPWEPYRSIGTWYMWQSLRNEPLREQSAVSSPESEREGS